MPPGSRKLTSGTHTGLAQTIRQYRSRERRDWRNGHYLLSETSTLSSYHHFPRAISAKLSAEAFEKSYLDWAVINLRDLKLTGIISTDETKRPRLEQVFTSLTFAEQRDRATYSGSHER
jgi:hypothetical protein